MSKTATEIVERALTLMDETTTDFGTVGTSEASLKDIGLELLPEVARDLIKELPYELKSYLSEAGSLSQYPLTDGESQEDYIKQKLSFILPTDFWELVSVKLQGWAKPVTSYIYVDSSEYSKQNNPFTRAGNQNPVAAISNAGDNLGNKRTIELFSLEKGEAPLIDYFNFISFDNIPDDSGNNWPDELFDEITGALASKILIVKGDLEQGAFKGHETTNAIKQHI